MTQKPKILLMRAECEHDPAVPVAFLRENQMSDRLVVFTKICIW